MNEDEEPSVPKEGAENMPEPRSKAHLKQVNVSNLGNWEKHTKGFGMKMLQKMGFKGRLGKEEHGISAPVAVKVRPDKMGLGFGSFQEASKMKQNRQIEHELHGTALEQNDEHEDDSLKRTLERTEVEDGGFWRKRSKGSAKKRQRVYQTVEEMLEDSVEKSSGKILDRRGPETKEWLNLADAQVGVEPPPAPKFGQELMYNVQRLVNDAEGQILHLDQNIRSKEDRLVSMEYELKQLKKQTRKAKGDLLKFKSISSEVSAIKAIAESSSTSGLEIILERLMKLREEYAVEFQQFQLYDLVPAIVSPALKMYIQHWNPLKGENEELFKRLSMIKNVLLRTLQETSTESPLLSDSDILSNKVFEKIMDDILLPYIRPFVIKTWNPREPVQCTALMNCLAYLLPQKTMSKLLQQCVVPKLRMECERWDPKTDPTHVHVWLLPWRHLLQDDLNSMYPQIRHTIGNALQHWHPKDTTAFDVLLPWKSIWLEGDFFRFILQYIVPKCARCLQSEFVVNPRNQDLEPLQWVLQYRNLMTADSFVALIVGEFFPKWSAALSTWLKDGPQFSEVLHWYLGWKELLPTELVASVYYRRKMNVALMYINNACNGEDLRGIEIEHYDSYRKCYSRIQLENGITSAPKEKATVKKSKSEVTVKELLEGIAADHGIVFIPDLKRGSIDGKRVYQFGKLSIVLDQGIVSVEDSKHRGRFNPTSLEDLLVKAQ